MICNAMRCDEMKCLFHFAKQITLAHPFIYIYRVCVRVYTCKSLTICDVQMTPHTHRSEMLNEVYYRVFKRIDSTNKIH